METVAHQMLKRHAVAWLQQWGCRVMAMEVRCPIARYVVDVAGYIDRPVKDEQTRRRDRPPPQTVCIECKQDRGDFLRDGQDRTRLLAMRDDLDRLRRHFEEARIKSIEPHLRSGDGALFPELEQWDFSRSRHRAYRGIITRIRRIEQKLHGETKFFMMARYRLADRLYIAAPRGLITQRELPRGWGLLECPPRCLYQEEPGRPVSGGLRVRVTAPDHAALAERRTRLLRNIAAAGSRSLLHGVEWDGSLAAV